MYQLVSTSVTAMFTNEKPRILYEMETFAEAKADLESIKFHRAVKHWEMSDRGRCLSVVTKDGRTIEFRIVKK